MEESTIEEPNEIYEEPRGWFGISLLTWCVVLSGLLHSSFLAGSFLEGPRGELDVDLEWLTTFDSLEGIGHGAGRWAELGPQHAPADMRPPPEPVGPEPPADLPPPPEPEKPSKKPAPKSPASPRPKPKPKPDAPAPEAPAKPRTPTEVFNQGDLPGLDRAGPNALPAMEGYGPGNAVFSALVRFDRIRGTEFEEPTRKLVAAVPDYRILLDGTGVDPVRDFHSMFMASANPIYIEETFLAVRHSAGKSALRDQLDRRFESALPWHEERTYSTRALVPPNSEYSDPRQIMLPSNDLALVVRPEWIRQLVGTLPDDSRLVEGVDLAALNQRPTMLDGLAHIERAAEADDTIVLVSAMGARFVIPGIGRLTFDGAKLRIWDLAEPRLVIDVAMPTEAEASKFAAGCPALKEKIFKEVPWVARNITKMVVERLTCEPSGRYVAIRGTYTRQEVQRVLNIVLPFVPRPPELAKLPRPKTPPPQPPAPTVAVAPDAGVTASSTTGMPPDPAAQPAAPPELVPPTPAASPEAAGEPAAPSVEGQQQDSGSGEGEAEQEKP